MLFVARAIRVKKAEANTVIKRLIRENLLDDEWKIVEDGEYLIVPVKGWIKASFEYPLPPRRRKKKPYEKIVETAERIGIKRDELPDYWERIGDVLILPNWNFGRDEKKIGEIYARVLKVKTVCVYEGIVGELRIQKVRTIYGDSTETVHMENGIKYKLDVSKIMFSSGNVNERIRMSKMDVSDETIVDMFAGIGYFTLPLAVYGDPKVIYACEKNPIAYYYLLENLGINRVGNVIPLFGDNRSVCPRGIADRVIMGYIRTWPFLKFGLEILRGEGIIHYHDTFRDEEIPHIEEKIKNYAADLGYYIEVLSKRIVKSYAPKIWHVAIDIGVRTSNS